MDPNPTIAGYPAELSAVAVEDHAPDGGRARTVPLFTVRALEEFVDADRLLKDPTAVEPPYWALVWIGAKALAARMLDRPPSAERSVLDLGCGLGLSGVAAALGGASVTFGDYVDEPLEFVRATLAHHEIERCEVSRIDFTRDRLDRRFDLILAADIVYDPAHYEPLVEFLCTHAAPGTTVLLTETLRADARRVTEGLVERGFSETIDAVWIPEDGKRERTWVHTLNAP